MRRSTSTSIVSRSFTHAELAIDGRHGRRADNPENSPANGYDTPHDRPRARARRFMYSNSTAPIHGEAKPIEHDERPLKRGPCINGFVAHHVKVVLGGLDRDIEGWIDGARVGPMRNRAT